MSKNPFWFGSEEVLTALLKDEFRLITELFAKYPPLREFFDLPEAVPEQRSACFTLLAHQRLIGEIEEKFLGMQQQPPALADEEKNVIPLMQNLFADDAPAWVLEASQFADLLPTRIYEQLPEPLRRGTGFYANDLVQKELIASAVRELGSVEKIRTLIEMVIGQQLKRLEGRWGAAKIQVAAPPQTERKKSKRQPKGTEGLGQKIIDLSRYMDGLTEKQHLAFSLKKEYGLKLSEIAVRMGVNRKTAYEHLNAAARRIDQTWSKELREAKRATTNLDD